ncbi:MAG: NEW3 domain-containing protein, partial [Mycobacterium sp.]
TTDVAITSGLHRLSAASRVDLLEERRLQKHRAFEGLSLHGYEIATVLTRLNLPQLLEADHTQLAPEAEAAQPLYARYWLHNRGPAPLGGLPAVAHLHPQAIVAEPNDPVVLRLTAASDCTDSVLHGTVRLVCPDGWTASPARLPFVLPSGEHLEADVELTMPPDTAPGLYPVRAQLVVTGDDAESMPASWRQVVEDVATVSVGTPREDNVGALPSQAGGLPACGGLVYLVGEPDDVKVTAGEAARLAVTVGTAAGASLALEAHLISPWGTWEWMGPAAQGAVLWPGETVELGFDIAPPPWVQPGEWWALVRVGCAGRLVYSPAVKVTVR